MEINGFYMQVIYNPRRQKGLGLTDGECVERLWSYLGKFSNISKEMTPENRTDLLVDGLLHYGKRIIQKQGTTMPYLADFTCLLHKQKC